MLSLTYELAITFCNPASAWCGCSVKACAHGACGPQGKCGVGAVGTCGVEIPIPRSVGLCPPHSTSHYEGYIMQLICCCKKVKKKNPIASNFLLLFQNPRNRWGKTQSNRQPTCSHHLVKIGLGTGESQWGQRYRA